MWQCREVSERAEVRAARANYETALTAQRLGDKSVHLLLDTGHATFGGGDPAALARRHRARISHFHAKDIRPDVMATAKAQRLSFLDAVISGVFTVPGDGCVDYPAVLRELTGYSGWAVVEAEQDPEKARPLTYAKLGFRNLDKYLRDAGLR